MDNKKIKELFNKINIEIDDKKIDMFNLYEQNLIDWNNKINLTTILDDEEIWIKHFIDSCTIIKYLNKNCSLLDIGTGAGFPGLPIKIIYDDIKLSLLDSLNKRILFLEDTVKKIELNDVNFIHGRAEDFANEKTYREQFDFVTARAVANLSTLSEYCLPFVKIGGRFICMKAGNVEEEIDSAKNAIKILGGEIEIIEKFNLVDLDIERTIIIIKKVKNTAKEYPRKAGIPSKKPL